MELSAILTTVLNIFATSPDLCADVYLDANGQPWTDAVGQTLSRYCRWTGPGAPVLNSDVCCQIEDDLATCVLPNRKGRCSSGSRYFCEYGQVDRTGVVCLQPFRSACDEGYCVAPPEVPPPTQANLICCWGNCVLISHNQIDPCHDYGGTVLWCWDGVSNADGTVTCLNQY